MSGFTSGMKSSLSNEWTTPRDLFDELDAEFHFTLDAASTDENALCEQHYTIDDDGLKQEWTGSVWLNPPYGREIGAWIQKAAQSNRGGGSLFALFLLEPTRDGGTNGSWAMQPKSGLFADGSSSETQKAALRFRQQSSYTTSDRKNTGQLGRRTRTPSGCAGKVMK